MSGFIHTLSLGKAKTSVSYHPPEDSYRSDSAGGLLIVADGVTRDRNARGDYPNPSPARLAADVFCDVALAHLKAPDIDEVMISSAFAAANEAIRSLNVSLGLDRAVDYLENDFAGTVGAVAIVRQNILLWGYIGDCGIAVLDGRGDIRWRTSDDVAAVRNYFPTKQVLSSIEARKVSIRKDFRNNPDTEHSYGVLTGEDLALKYVKTGVLGLDESDRVLVFSDGACEILTNTTLKKCLLTSANKLQTAVLAQRETNTGLDDDITLLVTDPVA